MKRVLLTRPERQGVSYLKQDKKKKVDGNKPTPPPTPLKGGWVGVGCLPMPAEKQNKVDTLLDLTKDLSPAERKELLARLSLEGQTLKTGETRDIDMWVGAVYDGLVEATGHQGEGVPGPAAIKRVLAIPTAWAPVSSFMRASKMDKVTVTQRQSAYHMLANLVIENARYVSRTSRIPLSPKLVGNCASNITGIFDQAFPGYLQSGLAHIVVRRLTDAKDF